MHKSYFKSIADTDKNTSFAKFLYDYFRFSNIQTYVQSQSFATVAVENIVFNTLYCFEGNVDYIHWREGQQHVSKLEKD